MSSAAWARNMRAAQLSSKSNINISRLAEIRRKIEFAIKSNNELIKLHFGIDNDLLGMLRESFIELDFNGFVEGQYRFRFSIIDPDSD